MRVSLYKDGEEVKFLRFATDGTKNTDGQSDTWFSVNHLIDSGWSDMNAQSLPLYLDWWIRKPPQ